MAPVRTLPPRRAPPCSGSTSALVAGRSSNRIDPARQLCLQYHNCTCCSSCWRSSGLRASSKGTGPSIQQDQSSGAVASAISQLHLLFVLLALLRRGGRSSKHPSESIQQGQCVCIITLTLAARPDGVFSTILALLLHQSTSAPSMATTALHCSMDSPVPVRHAAAMSSAHANTYGNQ